MVSIRNIVAAIALASPVIALITPAQVVLNIQLITQKSQALQGPAQNINIFNGPLIVIGQGPFPVGAPSSFHTLSNSTDYVLANHRRFQRYRHNCHNRHYSDERHAPCSGRPSI